MLFPFSVQLSSPSQKNPCHSFYLSYRTEWDPGLTLQYSDKSKLREVFGRLVFCLFVGAFRLFWVLGSFGGGGSW